MAPDSPKNTTGTEQTANVKDDRADLGDDPEEHFDSTGDSATVSDAWTGTFLYTSWGQGQTNVEMAKITQVSDSGKTVKARRVGADSVSTEKGSESVRPSAI